MGIISKIREHIRAFIGMPHINRYAISANEAKIMSIYGSPGLRSRYITNILEVLSRKIRDATRLRKFAIFEKLDPDCEDVLPDIIEYFRIHGFGVKIIDQTDIQELYDDRYIIIAWKDIKNEEFSSDSPGDGQEVLDLESTSSLRDSDSV